MGSLSFTLFPYTTLFRSHEERSKYTINTIFAAIAVIFFGCTTSTDPVHYREKYECNHSSDHRFTCSVRSEEHTSELQSRAKLVCRILLDTKRILRGFRGH